MRRSHRVLTLAVTVWAGLFLAGAAKAQQGEWVSLFDGKTLDGWEKVGNEQSVWEVKDGALCGSGPASMLVSTKGPYKDFRYRAEIKINDGGNSGLYFRTTRRPGFADGYEAQIDSTHTDPIRTGSLYGLCHVYKRLVEPDAWFTYEVEVRDDVWRKKPVTRIKITVNGDELFEYLDFEQRFQQGHFAFQQHDPGSRVCIRKVEVMDLSPEPDKEPDVIFVPTPQKVVDRMLELAQVKKGDVVYDLGCGDGRIPVTAAKKYGVKAWGFDVDPVRIQESLENVQKNGVGDRVTIVKKDIFTLDLSQADVVTLYLLPSLNVKLISQLEKLKPGCRIVSHDFDMEGIKPTRVETIEAGREHTIYLWITPLERE